MKCFRSSFGKIAAVAFVLHTIEYTDKPKKVPKLVVFIYFSECHTHVS